MTLDDYNLLTTTMSKILDLDSRKVDLEGSLKKKKAEQRKLIKQEQELKSSITTLKRRRLSKQYDTAEEKSTNFDQEINQNELLFKELEATMSYRFSGFQAFLLLIASLGVSIILGMFGPTLPFTETPLDFDGSGERCENGEFESYENTEDCLAGENGFYLCCYSFLLLLCLSSYLYNKSGDRADASSAEIDLQRKHVNTLKSKRGTLNKKMREMKKLISELAKNEKDCINVQAKIEGVSLDIESMKINITELKKEIKKLLESVAHLTPYYDKINL